MKRAVALLAMLLSSAPLSAQSDSASAPAAIGVKRRPGSVSVDSLGVIFAAPDSSAEIILRFRMQLLSTGESTDGQPLGFNGQVRRLRVRFGGWLMDPRLTFNLQLSFSRADQDFADTEFPNIVRDAAIHYQATNHLRFTAGQTKLPGNRQRVISSADLQSAERSIVNLRYNIDRDFLLMGALRDTVAGRVPVHLTAAISSGEGRNSGISAAGLAYTGRVEVQPFGPFTRGGDDFEGDLEHEPTPKLALGAVYSKNVNARRTGGQLGPALFDPRTMETFLADVLLKYRGVALYGEYADRDARDPVTRSAGQPDRAIYVGRGAMVQASYYIKDAKLEPSFRYAVTTPDAVLAGVVGTERQEQVAFNLTRYFRRHRVRTHAEFGWIDSRNEATLAQVRSYIGRFNIELGI